MILKRRSQRQLLSLAERYALVDWSPFRRKRYTVWGANAFDEAAVAKIFAAKGRPANDPLIVHIARFDQLSQVAKQIPAGALELSRRFWPGPLTLVLQKAERIPANLTAGLDTVAVRMPDHDVALALLRAANVPIAAPSANQFSRPSPTSSQHVIDDLDGLVDVVLDGGLTPIGVESTILSLIDAPPRILRPGGIAVEALRELIPDLRYEPSYLNDELSAAPAPGTMLRHYSPRARVILFSGDDDVEVYAAMRAEIAAHDRVGILASDADLAAFADLDVPMERLGADADDRCPAFVRRAAFPGSAGDGLHSGAYAGKDGLGSGGLGPSAARVGGLAGRGVSCGY